MTTPHKKRRVLHLANQAGPLHLFSMPIFEALREAGFEVELACTDGGPLWDAIQGCDFPLHQIEGGNWSRPGGWIKAYRSVRALLKRGQYDVMVVHTPVMSWLARYAARGLVGKVAYLAHGLPFAPSQSQGAYELLRHVECSLARYTDAVIVMNQADQDACDRYRLTRRNGRCYRVLGEGIEVEEYAAKPTAQELADLHTEFGLDPDKPLVLFLGRFLATKRPGDLVEAARRIGPKAQFLLAGGGPIWEQTRRAAQAVGPHVQVVPFTHQARALLHRCDIVAMPSVYREGMPRILLEAQLLHAPPVAYDVRGSSDAIVDGETGLLIPPRDVSAFTAGLERLLDEPALREKLARAGEKRVRENFSFDRIAQEHLAITQQILEQT